MNELIAMMNNALLARLDHDRVFIDAKNAFNECRRDKATETILEHCPELAGIFFALYGKHTRVWLRADYNDNNNNNNNDFYLYRNLILPLTSKIFY